jgi:protoheme IX farnesyltransferase
MVLSFVPLSLGMSSYLSFIVMILAALFFMSIAVKLYVSNKKEDAKKLMLGSLVYQLVVFITLIIDKQ